MDTKCERKPRLVSHRDAPLSPGIRRQYCNPALRENKLRFLYQSRLPVHLSESMLKTRTNMLLVSEKHSC